MDAVILFSHGSVLCGAGEALYTHAERLRSAGIAPQVAVGYLNYSEPLFAETVQQCAAAGATRILVAPYFLIPGYFVKVDLPKAVEAAQAAHPAMEFVIAPPLGFDETLAEALIASAQEARDPSFWRDDLRRASRACRANPQCPLYGNTSAGCLVVGDSIHHPPPARDTEARREEGEGKREERREGAVLETGTVENRKYQRPALLVMVHGSPRPVANAEMFRVVEGIQQRQVFPIVEVGFMECNEPTIPDAIETCVAQGATQILAVPYFLHTGTHVAEDLPTLLEAGRERHPTVEFRMGAYLGRSECVTDLLAKRIQEAREQRKAVYTMSERKN